VVLPLLDPLTKLMVAMSSPFFEDIPICDFRFYTICVMLASDGFLFSFLMFFALYCMYCRLPPKPWWCWLSICFVCKEVDRYLRSTVHGVLSWLGAVLLMFSFGTSQFCLCLYLLSFFLGEAGHLLLPEYNLALLIWAKDTGCWGAASRSVRSVQKLLATCSHLCWN
jgi:hypothetical protein